GRELRQDVGPSGSDIVFDGLRSCSRNRGSCQSGVMWIELGCESSCLERSVTRGLERAPVRPLEFGKCLEICQDGFVAAEQRVIRRIATGLEHEINIPGQQHPG